jgi:hypothetical protein
MTRKECPFCGNIHVKPRATGNLVKKAFVECPRYDGRYLEFVALHRQRAEGQSVAEGEGRCCSAGEGGVKRSLIDLALAVGFKAEAVKKWRQRGHVPVKHRDGLLRSARRRRLPVTEADFTFAPTGRTGFRHVGAIAKDLVRNLIYQR